MGCDAGLRVSCDQLRGKLGYSDDTLTIQDDFSHAAHNLC